ncbi:unnamed protein product [Rotaria sp. Silwood2]|nr:unnamed protein product [Rotaria sp. Silwood2]CAF4539582.1 unnamed protein product [Rotaria sp. Silwood2]
MSSSFSESLPVNKLLAAISEHKFIQSINSGQISTEQFNTWLTQDYLSVISYVRFIAHVLANAPQQDYKVLINSLSALAEELAWFESQLKARGDLINKSQLLPANLAYQQWLAELIKTETSYLALITLYYSLELYYHQAWKSVKNHDYHEFVSRWGCDAFGQFVEQLKAAVDSASSTASEEDKKKARQLCGEIAQYEILAFAIWQ